MAANIPTLDYYLDKKQKKLDYLVEKGIPQPQAEEMLTRRTSQIRDVLAMNFDALETSDKELLNTTAKSIFRRLLIAAVPAVGLNIALSTITGGRVFDLPLYARVGLRSFIFGLPAGTFGNYAYNTYYRLSFYLEDKYEARVAAFTKTGDPSALNPNLANQ